MAFDSGRAIALGHFVDAAYAMHASSEDNVALPPPRAIPAGYTFIAWIVMDDFFPGGTTSEFYGFVAQDDADPSQCVLALRGAEDVAEWWDSAHAGFHVFDVAPGNGSVHAGFYALYRTLRVIDYRAGATAPSGEAAPPRTFADEVDRVARRHLPPYGYAASASLTFAVAAHSLGAALATYFTLDMAVNHRVNRVGQLCTFASPRTGDATFASAVNVSGAELWRIVNLPDVVPQIPYRWLGYQHTGGLVLINATGSVRGTLRCWHLLDTYLFTLGSPIELGDCAPDARDADLLQRAADPALSALGNELAESLAT